MGEIIHTDNWRNKMAKIALGVKAKDQVTGFKGIVTARVEYLYGCAQWGITPPSKDGEVKNTQYFDEGRVVFVDVGVAPAAVQAEKPGAGEAPSVTHGLR